LQKNISGGANTGTGFNALFNNNGIDNKAAGFEAMFQNTNGSDNTANGIFALFNNTTGDANTAIGRATLSNNTTGTGNIALGVAAGSAVTTANNVICIGIRGLNATNSCFIGNIFGHGAPDGVTVFINSDGQLGTNTSSRRFKNEIKPMDRASEVLLALKPVTFRYKNEIDPQGRSQFGLVAEEVETVNPNLVVRDKEGKPYSVRYDQVNAMLLNEFLKEHRTVQAQQKEIDALRAELKEQRALIQNVNDKVELSRPAPQTIMNNR